MEKKNDSEWYFNRPQRKANVIALLTEGNGENEFILNLKFMNEQDGRMSPSVDICFDSIDELQSLADYIVGLAKELKKEE